MSILSENLRYLRAQKKCSQQYVANELIISRGRYSKYEDDKSEPPLEILQRICHYFHISIDLLLAVDLRDILIDDLLKMQDNMFFVPITLDKINGKMIRIIVITKGGS